MKSLKTVLVIGMILGVPGISFSEETQIARVDQPKQLSLDEQLDTLNLPANQAPQISAQEKLYSVQSRYAPLSLRHELALSGARNLTADGLLTSHQVGATYRFHLGDRWSLSLTGIKIFNSLSSSGENLLGTQDLAPDVDFARYSGDLSATFNTFYGKFRLGMDSVLYFDQYVSLGGGVVGLESGSSPMATADLGFVFWVGKKGSVRIGLRDQFYKERRQFSEAFSHNLIAHLDVGILLGGSDE